MECYGRMYNKLELCFFIAWKLIFYPLFILKMLVFCGFPAIVIKTAKYKTRRQNGTKDKRNSLYLRKK